MSPLSMRIIDSISRMRICGTRFLMLFAARAGLGSCFSSAMLEIDGRTFRVTVPLSLICAVRLMKKPIDTDCGVVVVAVGVGPAEVDVSCLTLK
jgi:hypothetical protein